jgi:hypothetical protein
MVPWGGFWKFSVRIFDCIWYLLRANKKAHPPTPELRVMLLILSYLWL